MLTDAERLAMGLLNQDPAECEDCGESFKPWDARAEVVRRPGGEVLLIHAECMRESDELA